MKKEELIKVNELVSRILDSVSDEEKQKNLRLKKAMNKIRQRFYYLNLKTPQKVK